MTDVEGNIAFSPLHIHQIDLVSSFLRLSRKVACSMSCFILDEHIATLR